MSDQADKLRELMIDSDAAADEVKAAEAMAAADCDAGTLTELREEVQAEEIGGIARDEDEATLLRYLRSRQRAAMELAHIKEQTRAIIEALGKRIQFLDQIYTAIAADIVKRKLGNGKSRSIKTPFGTVGFRLVRGNVIVVDEAKLIAAARADAKLKHLIRVETAIVKSEVNQHYKNSGELVAGTDLAADEDRFYVK